MTLSTSYRARKGDVVLVRGVVEYDNHAPGANIHLKFGHSTGICKPEHVEQLLQSRLEQGDYVTVNAHGNGVIYEVLAITDHWAWIRRHVVPTDPGVLYNVSDITRSDPPALPEEAEEMKATA